MFYWIGLADIEVAIHRFRNIIFGRDDEGLMKPEVFAVHTLR